MRILSISSHVAYGHVGHGASTFALQRLGFEVVAVPTVVYSNHPGYGAWRGPVLAADDVGAVIEGLAEIGALAGCDGVLTSYMPDASVAAAAAEAVGRTRGASPNLLVCCDPVLGDLEAGYYVPAAVADVMRTRLLPAADLGTPNLFELEVLTGLSAHNLDATIVAAQAARDLGPKWVLVTSLQHSDGPAKSIEMLLVGADGAWTVSVPRLTFTTAPSGGGDLTSALFLAHMLGSRDPVTALAVAAAGVFAVYDVTARAGSRELQIIAAQQDLVTPKRTFAPVKVR